MINRHHPPGYPDVLQLRADETAGFVGEICVVQYEGPAGRVPVHPLYHRCIACGNYENAASPGQTGVEDGYIPIADVSPSQMGASFMPSPDTWTAKRRSRGEFYPIRGAVEDTGRRGP